MITFLGEQGKAEFFQNTYQIFMITNKNNKKFLHPIEFQSIIV